MPVRHPDHTESGTQAGGTAMTALLISKLPGSHSRTEAEDELLETSPWPIALVGVSVLLLGDVALTLAAIGAVG